MFVAAGDEMMGPHDPEMVPCPATGLEQRDQRADAALSENLERRLDEEKQGESDPGKRAAGLEAGADGAAADVRGGMRGGRVVHSGSCSGPLRHRRHRATYKFPQPTDGACLVGETREIDYPSLELHLATMKSVHDKWRWGWVWVWLRSRTTRRAADNAGRVVERADELFRPSAGNCVRAGAAGVCVSGRRWRPSSSLCDDP